MDWRPIFVLFAVRWNFVATKCWNTSLLQDGIQFHPNIPRGFGMLKPELILTGPLYQTGDFLDCVDHLHEQYCMTEVLLQPINESSRLWEKIQDSNRVRTHFRRDILYVGLCTQKCCEASEIAADFEDYLTPGATNLGVAVNVSIKEGSCKVVETQSFHAIDYLTVFVIFLLIVLVLAGTSYEAVLKIKKDEKPKNIPGSRFLLCFSALTNWQRLTSLSDTKEAKSFQCIQGIRALSMYLVVAAHVMYGIMIKPLKNPQYMEQSYHDFLRAGFINGQSTMSTFFCISGLLLTYHFLKEADARGTVTVSSVLQAIFRRYLRLTPLYALVILLEISLLNNLGQGPMWSYIVTQECKNCQNYWWTNIFYINNYVHALSPCMLHTWYLAADFQCYVVMLLVLVPVWKYPRYAKMILFSALGIWILVPFLQTYVEKLEPVILATPENIKHFPEDRTFHKTYTTFHCNAGAYTVGVIFGYYYYYRNEQVKKSKRMFALVWSVLLTVPWTVMVVPFVFYQENYKYNVIVACLFQGLSKVVYAAGIGTIILGCATGYGWIANKIISWRPFQVLGRLSYALYLVHPCIIRAEAGSILDPAYISDYWLFQSCSAHLVLSTSTAVILCFLVELPSSALIGLTFKAARQKDSAADVGMCSVDNNIDLKFLPEVGDMPIKSFLAMEEKEAT